MLEALTIVIIYGGTMRVLIIEGKGTCKIIRIYDNC